MYVYVCLGCSSRRNILSARYVSAFQRRVSIRINIYDFNWKYIILGNIIDLDSRQGTVKEIENQIVAFKEV